MDTLLNGIRVLDFTRDLSGNYCTMLLASYGAEVIRVKYMDQEDEHLPGPEYQGISLRNVTLNKNKKCIRISHKTPEGEQILCKLLKKSDILVEDRMPGEFQKEFMGYEDIKKIAPGLVMASISPFGQTGCWKDRVGTDATIQALTGLMSITGTEETGPLLIGVPWADYLAGAYAAYYILVARYYQEQTGKGQYIDISKYDSLSVVGILPEIIKYQVSGVVPARLGNRDRSSAPSNAFITTDGYCSICVTSQFFAPLAKAIGMPELIDDPKFCTNEERLKRADEIEAIVETWTSVRSCDEVIRTMDAYSIPSAVVADASRLLNNEQIKARKVIDYVEYPGNINIPVVGQCIKFSKTPEVAPQMPDKEIAIDQMLQEFGGADDE